MKTAANNIERVGLEAHLEATRESHNGYGFAEFADMRRRQVNRANLARIFGVNTKTMKRWIEIYEKETQE